MDLTNKANKKDWLNAISKNLSLELEADSDRVKSWKRKSM